MSAKKQKFPMSDHEYAQKHGGGKCPYCGSDEIDGELDGESYWTTVICLKCHKRWRDIYLLHEYSALNEQGQEVALTGKPEDPTGTKFYLVVVRGCVEAESPHGPYPTEEDRNNAAKFIHTELDEEDAGPFWLDISNKGVPNMGAYSGRFFEEDDNAKG